MSYPEVVYTSPARRDGNTLYYLLRIVRAVVLQARSRGHEEEWIRRSVTQMIERSFLKHHGEECRDRVRAMAGRVLEEAL